MILKTRIPDGSQAPQWLQKIQYTLKPLAYMDAAAQRYGDIFNAPVIGNHPIVLLAIPKCYSTFLLMTRSNLLLHQTNSCSRLWEITLFLL